MISTVPEHKGSLDLQKKNEAWLCSGIEQCQEGTGQRMDTATKSEVVQESKGTIHLNSQTP